MNRKVLLSPDVSPDPFPPYGRWPYNGTLRPRQLHEIDKRPPGIAQRLKIRDVKTELPLNPTRGLKVYLEFEAASLHRATGHLSQFLKSRPHNGAGRTGKVVFVLRRHADGRITNVRRVEDGLGMTLSTLAEGALLAEPWAPWPPELRQTVGSDTCELTIECWLEAAAE